MRIFAIVAILSLHLSCKDEPPKQPERDRNDYYGSFDQTGGFSNTGFDDYSTYGNSSYYDSGSNVNNFNSGFGTADQFNSGSTFNYGNSNFNCDQLYGQGYNNQFDRFGNSSFGTMNNGMMNNGTLNNGTMNNGMMGGTYYDQFSNPLADCTQFNQGNNYNFQYQDPGMYQFQQNLQMQNRFYDQMADNQRNMMLMQLIPNVLGALTGNQQLINQNQNLGFQNQFSNPQFNTPGMGLSGFSGQFGNINNPFFQNQGLNPQFQNGMYDQFGQYGNYNMYNGNNFNNGLNNRNNFNTISNNGVNGNSQWSNRNFYDDPNFSNGLSGRNSFYNSFDNRNRVNSTNNGLDDF